MIVEGIDVDFYEKHDFGPEMKKAREEGRLYVHHGCTIENVMDKIREVRGELHEPKVGYK